MEKRLQLTLNDEDEVQEIGKAISNPIRIKILRLLSYESLNVQEIATRLNMPFSTIASNIDILEKSGLISCSFQAGKHGSMKLCAMKSEQAIINLHSELTEKTQSSEKYSLPIGSYSSFNITPTCGLTDEKGFLGRDDDIRTFYSSDRFKAQLLWFFQGYVEYKIPLEKNDDISSIEIQMELCSEAPNYREDFPSDITFSLNGVEVGTYTSPGDFGGRRGKLTPEWWSLASTQFGLLKTIKVDQTSTTIDNKRVSSIKTSDLQLPSFPCLTLRIEIKKDAKNIGGINIFGHCFGDYPTDIEISLIHNIITK